MTTTAPTRPQLRAELLEVFEDQRALADTSEALAPLIAELYPAGQRPGPQMTADPQASDLARGELLHLLREASAITCDERGMPVRVVDVETGEELLWEPWWNAFGHPIHDIDDDAAEERAVAALGLLARAVERLW